MIPMYPAQLKYCLYSMLLLLGLPLVLCAQEVEINDNIGVNLKLNSRCGFFLQVTGSRPSCPETKTGVASVVPLVGSAFNVDQTWLDAQGKTVGQGPQLANVRAGLYRMILKDQQSCQDSLRVIIKEADNFLQIAERKAEDNKCFGEEKGFISVRLKDTNRLKRVLLNGTEKPDYKQLKFTNLPSNKYLVTLEDDRQCKNELVFEIISPAKLETRSRADTTRCPATATGAVRLSASGGVAPYAYALDGVSNGFVKDFEFDNLKPQPYVYFVKDNNGCESKGVTVVADRNPVTQTIDDKQDVTCPGKEDGKFIIIIEAIDANGYYGDFKHSLNGTGFTNTPVFDQLKAGRYLVVSQSQKVGCSFSTTVEIKEPEAPTVKVSVREPLCADDQSGVIALQAEGVTAPFRYGLALSQLGNVQVFQGLSGGDYTLYVVDALGCLYERAVFLTEPEKLVSAYQMEDAHCGLNNGWIFASASGGTPPYQYAWNTGGQGRDLIGLGAGDYELRVADRNGCTVKTSIQVNQYEPPQFVARVKPASCHDSNDGAIALELVGNSPVVSIHWSDGSQGELVDDLEPGIYRVTIEDAYQCAVNSAFQITQPAPIHIQSEVIQVGNKADILVDATGGAGGFSFLWSNGVAASGLHAVLPGDYIVTITDEKGCTATEMFTVAKKIRPLERSLGIYPVPAESELYLDFDLPEQHLVQITVYDLWGRKVLLAKDVEVSNGILTLDLDQLAAAPYVLHLTLDNGEWLQRKIEKL